MTLIDFIQAHPKLALIVGTVNLFVAHHLTEYQIPTIIMQVIQIAAWGVTITVGCITLYGTYKKWRAK